MYYLLTIKSKKHGNCKKAAPKKAAVKKAAPKKLLLLRKLLQKSRS